MKTYEKPAMKMVNLRNEDTVADTCWGHHSSGTVLFCDINGSGYCSFQIARGSCELNLINVQYYDSKNDTEPESVSNGDDAYDSLFAKLHKYGGGNTGNAFKGIDEIITPGTPDPTWS